MTTPRTEIGGDPAAAADTGTSADRGVSGATASTGSTFGTADTAGTTDTGTAGTAETGTAGTAETGTACTAETGTSDANTDAGTSGADAAAGIGADHARGLPRLAVVSASVRADRLGPVIADWVVAHARRSFTVDPIDLADVELPDDGLLEPGGGPRSEVAGRIADASAFLFVTPEYNHSFPASLKRLLDWHYTEWMLKAASIVSYGVAGGYPATEQLRTVLAELSMHTTRRTLGLAAPWESLDDGRFAPGPPVTAALTGLVGELRWWAEMLDDARRTRPFTG